MNVIKMMHEILVISNSVVRESALPDFAPATQNRPEGVRVPAFDELNRMLERIDAAIEAAYDETYAGFGTEMKFPMTDVLTYLVQEYRCSGSSRA